MSVSITMPNGLKLEVHEETAGDEIRSWRWRAYSERGHECTVELSPRDAVATPGGTRSLNRPWTRDEILQGVAWAVHRALVSPPEKKLWAPFHVNVGHFDLYGANGKL